MSISIEKPFSEWKPKPPKDRNNWALLAVIAVVGAFGCGTLVGYVLRDPAIEIERLRLAAEKSAKQSKDSLIAAAEAQENLVGFVRKLGIGISRKQAQDRLKTGLPEYDLRFTNGTANNGVPFCLCEVGDHFMKLNGPEDGLFSATVYVVSRKKPHVAVDLLKATRLLIDPEWPEDEAEEWFSEAITKTNPQNGCFTIRGKNRVSTRFEKYGDGQFFAATYSTDLER